MLGPKKTTASLVFFFSLGLVAVLTLTSAASGVNGFDEPIQFLGLKSTLEHAADIWKLKNPDFTAIHSNLEFYGIAPRLPAYLLWNISKLAMKILDPLGHLGLSVHAGNGLGDAYMSGYFALSHMVSVGYLIGIALIGSRVARKLGVQHPEYAGIMILFFPALLGFSLISVKDTAFAFIYSLYSYTLAWVWEEWLRDPIRCQHQSRRGPLCFHGCVAGILVSMTTSSFFLVLLSEFIFILAFSIKSSLSITFIAKQVGLFMVIVVGVWFLLSPPAWSDPLRFLIQSIAYSQDGSQAWGGCMHFLNACPRKGEDWSILKYGKNWLFSTLPLAHLFGLGLALFWLCAASLKLAFSKKSSRRLWILRSKLKPGNPFLWAFVLQTSVIPSILVMTNGFIYDGTRHLLFLLPPLAIFSYWGVAQTLTHCVQRWQRLLLLIPLFAMGLALLIDLFLLHPYQYTYFNELAMARGVNWKNTDIEFYYASDAESLRNFMKTDRFQQFASTGGLDIKGAPPLDHAYHVENFPRKRGHELFFTNHTREPGITLRKGCQQVGKNVFRKQLFGPVNIYGTPQVCQASNYRDWDPF